MGTDKKISDEDRVSFIKENHSFLSKDEMEKVFGPKMKNIEDFENSFE
jgi:hypothetical protein